MEIIVVDSSPNNLCEEIISKNFQGIDYYHSKVRMLPHAARNYGVERSNGDVLIFSDPDIYAPTNWVSKMVLTWKNQKKVIVGGLRCHNKETYKKGVHLVKFDLWLPGGYNRQIEIAPTANMLIEKSIFLKVGYFETEEMLGDTLFSWRLKDFQEKILFAPQNFVDHDHTCSVKDFYKERLLRGNDFGRLRRKAENLSFGKLVLIMATSIIPARLIKLQFRILRNCINSSNIKDFFLGQPMIIMGWYMWFIGECKAYFNTK